MKKTNRLKIAALALAVSCTAAAVGIVAAQDYSGSDPLISKSYLDQVFYKQITDYVDSKTASSAGSEYQIITLTRGQSVVATGSLEIILRPGSSAVVISPVAENGIADLTGGTELYNGNNVPINAYCLIPRGDGRGITCTSDVAYVMVRGKYEIR
ncbi:MAG: hypothetical protein E7583_04605 [Ruminococcaceae bacterium]|nr:hypothetical protein [Oscillospiraceae bacterium]